MRTNGHKFNDLHNMLIKIDKEYASKAMANIDQIFTKINQVESELKDGKKGLLNCDKFHY